MYKILKKNKIKVITMAFILTINVALSNAFSGSSNTLATSTLRKVRFINTSSHNKNNSSNSSNTSNIKSNYGSLVDKNFREDIDIENLKTNIKYLTETFEDRSIGSDDNKGAEQYLYKQAKKYDLVPMLQEFSAYPLSQKNNNYVDLEQIVFGNNIIIKNRNYYENKKDVILVGHFDTVVNTPGANDNASGAAMALEFGRYLKDKNLSFNPIILLCNSEEAKMAGSKFYVNSLTPEEKSNIELVIVFDMVGSGEHYEIWNTSQEKQEGYYSKLAIEAAREMNLNLLTLISPNGNSDYRYFELNDIPTVSLMADGDPDYHMPTDGYHKIMDEYLINISRITLKLLSNIK